MTDIGARKSCCILKWEAAPEEAPDAKKKYCVFNETMTMALVMLLDGTRAQKPIEVHYLGT